MPHAVFNLGTQSASVDIAGSFRPLIPGIDPGGSRLGHPMKPALLILDAWMEPVAVNMLSALTINQSTYYLKLSNEHDGSPGLLLPVAAFGGHFIESTTVGRQVSELGAQYMNLFKARGTIWVSRFVGVRHVELNTVSTDADLHLDYEMIMIPWMDWFMRWDFIDNVVDNARDY